MVIEGPSGAGKSDLALRLIDRGARLVSDDRTRVTREGDQLVAHAPELLAERIEVRGLGIAHAPGIDRATVALIVSLGDEQRFPERRARDIAGVAVREIAINPFHAAAPIKVEWALRQPGLPPA